MFTLTPHLCTADPLANLPGRLRELRGEGLRLDRLIDRCHCTHRPTYRPAPFLTPPDIHIVQHCAMPHVHVT